MPEAKTFDVPAPANRPRHVAIIMDGNGRWAKSRGMQRIEGHRRGADVVREITTFARELEIAYLTLYSFSVQNWRRPVREIHGLMSLLKDYCESERETLMKNDIRLAVIGELGRLPAATRRAVRKLLDETADNRTMTLTLALDYGGREELVRATRRIAAAVREGELDPDAIAEATVETYLDTAGMPDPDLVLRTSGEVRLSNFLLWQAAYAELIFVDIAWPEFSRADFAAALRDYAGRVRRFGATSEQVADKGDG